MFIRHIAVVIFDCRFNSYFNKHYLARKPKQRGFTRVWDLLTTPRFGLSGSLNLV